MSATTVPTKPDLTPTTPPAAAPANAPDALYAVAPVAGVAPCITVLVNGQPEQTPACSLEDWMLARGLAPAALATAVNGDFVPRGQRAKRMLTDGDQIFTFQAIQGG